MDSDEDSFERLFNETGYLIPCERAIMARFKKDPNYSAKQALEDLTDELMAIDFEPDCSGAWQELITMADYSDSEDSTSPSSSSKSKKESPAKEKSASSSSSTSSKGQVDKSSSENDNNEKKTVAKKKMSTKEKIVKAASTSVSKAIKKKYSK